MKITIIIIRTLIGLLFIFTSISYFFNLMPEPVTTGNFKAFQIGIVASTYLIPLAKSVELLCGLSFLSGRYVTLAHIVFLLVFFKLLSLLLCFFRFIALFEALLTLILILVLFLIT